MRLPETGMHPDEVRAALAAAAADDVAWRDGRGWSLVYDSPGWHSALVAEAAAGFANENALSHSAFPSAARFESAVISMVASVVSPETPAHGVFTAGGTESVLLAVKAYRDATGARGDVVVVPRTAHPAFWKAAHLLGLRIRIVEVGPSGAVDPDDVSRAVDDDVLMVGVSAPNFPYGVVDPVREVAALAAGRGVGVHVDAALGGLFLPFLDAVGGRVPGFGIDVPGVTSVSVDLHKYGYAAKGASVLLFRDEALRHAAYFVATGWPGGAYASASVLGTRPVGPAAAAFAAMAALGRDGYRRLVAQVMATAATLRSGLRSHGFDVVGTPEMSVFAVTATEPPLGSVVHGLHDRGWWVDTQDEPPSMHFVVFPRHGDVVAAFLGDVAAVVKDPPRAAEASSSYGVMVRDGGVSQTSLFRHLDDRYDGAP